MTNTMKNTVCETERAAWMPYRKFLDLDERMGAMYCGRSSCRKPSVWVSYSKYIDGRVTLCDSCYRKASGLKGNTWGKV